MNCTQNTDILFLVVFESSWQWINDKQVCIRVYHRNLLTYRYRVMHAIDNLSKPIFICIDVLPPSTNSATVIYFCGKHDFSFTLAAVFFLLLQNSLYISTNATILLLRINKVLLFAFFYLFFFSFFVFTAPDFRN